MADHEVVRRQDPLLGIWREDLRCESIWQAKTDGIVNLKFPCRGLEEDGVSARNCRRHHPAIKAANDWRVRVIRSHLMIEARSGIDTGKIWFAFFRAWWFPVRR